MCIRDSLGSDPETWYPRLERISARADMPIPPIPMKWMGRSRLIGLAKELNRELER